MAMFSQKVTIEQERRPCIVNGQRAMFHRWADSARPVTPRGIEEDETSERYQLHSVHGIVEFEGGTVQRVWPSEIRFIDHSEFEAYVWPEEDLQNE